MIRLCGDDDFEVVYEIINDGASAYEGVIAADLLGEPYMSRVWCFGDTRRVASSSG